MLQMLRSMVSTHWLANSFRSAHVTQLCELAIHRARRRNLVAMNFIFFSTSGFLLLQHSEGGRRTKLLIVTESSSMLYLPPFM